MKLNYPDQLGKGWRQPNCVIWLLKLLSGFDNPKWWGEYNGLDKLCQEIHAFSELFLTKAIYWMIYSPFNKNRECGWSKVSEDYLFALLWTDRAGFNIFWLLSFAVKRFAVYGSSWFYRERFHISKGKEVRFRLSCESAPNHKKRMKLVFVSGLNPAFMSLN